MPGPKGKTGSLLVPVAVLGAALMLWLWDPARGGWRWTCPFLWATGLPCGFCGMTRALHHLEHLEFARAWYFNPLAFPVAGTGLWLFAAGLRAVVSGRMTLPPLRARWVWAAVALFVVHWVLHARAAVHGPKVELLRPASRSIKGSIISYKKRNQRAMLHSDVTPLPA